MTELEFQKFIKDKRRKDDYLNYFLSFVFILMGLYFLTKSIREIIAAQTLDSGSKFGLFTVGLIPLSFGLYVLWRIPKYYLTNVIYSTTPTDKKIQIITDYFKDVRVVRQNVVKDLIETEYQNKYLTYIDVTVFVDNEKYLYYATGADLRGTKGVIDFGLQKRATNRLTRYLNKACLQH